MPDSPDRDENDAPEPGSWLEPPPSYDKAAYEQELEQLQIELVKVQTWARAQDERILLIFEGRDTAGKGGTIKRFREHLNPRFSPQVALPKPSDVETTQWYFQRYIEHLPSGGQVVFFDRSWYNRAGVERVMGFCTTEQYTRFMRQVTGIENALVDDGIRLFKLFLHVNRDEQASRLKARETNPLKQWKTSPIDAESVKRFDQYTQAQNEMFLLTDSAAAPWTVINSNDKKTARLNTMRHVLVGLPYDGKDTDAIGQVDPAIVNTPRGMFPGLMD